MKSLCASRRLSRCQTLVRAARVTWCLTPQGGAASFAALGAVSAAFSCRRARGLRHRKERCQLRGGWRGVRHLFAGRVRQGRSELAQGERELVAVVEEAVLRRGVGAAARGAEAALGAVEA